MARSRSSWTTRAMSPTPTSRSPNCAALSASVVGRPVEEMPLLTNRICGVCPEAHHMAAAKAARRGLSRGSAAHGQDAARAAVQRILLHRPHHPLLCPGRPGFRHGTGCARCRAQHPRRDPQGGAGDRRQGHPDAQVRTHRRRDDRRAQGASLHLHPRRHDQRHHRGTAQRDRRDGTLGDRVCPVQPEALQRYRAGQQGLCRSDPRRYLHPSHLLHGHWWTRTTRSISTMAKSAWSIPNGKEFVKYAPNDYTEQIAEHVEPWTYLKFPYLKKVGWKGFVDGKDSGVYMATPLSRLNASDGMATPRAQEEYERFYTHARRQTCPSASRHALGAADRIALCRRALGGTGDRSRRSPRRISTPCQPKNRPKAWASSRRRAAR